MTGGGISGLVYREVTGDAQAAGMLAAYGGTPAFFNSKAPSDSRPGWGDARYPRADFTVDMRQDAERKTAGTLTVNIYVTADVPQVGDLDPDRALERRLIELLSGVFFTDEAEGTFCTEWDRSDMFSFETQTGQTHPEVYGLSMTFDILAFPPQLTVDPDPIQGLNRWTKRIAPGAAAIGYDPLPEVFRPTDGHPAIYWRFRGAEADNRQSYAVTWYNGTFCAHVMTEGVMERNRWIKAIVEAAQAEGEVILPDTSPMFIQRISIRHGADPLREGQLELTGRYGVLTQQRKERAQMKLMHAYGSLGRKEGSPWKGKPDTA